MDSRIQGFLFQGQGLTGPFLSNPRARETRPLGPQVSDGNFGAQKIVNQGFWVSLIPSDLRIENALK